MKSRADHGSRKVYGRRCLTNTRRLLWVFQVIALLRCSILRSSIPLAATWLVFPPIPGDVIATPRILQWTSEATVDYCCTPYSGSNRMSYDARGSLFYANTQYTIPRGVFSPLEHGRKTPGLLRMTPDRPWWLRSLGGKLKVHDVQSSIVTLHCAH